MIRVSFFLTRVTILASGDVHARPRVLHALLTLRKIKEVTERVYFA